VINIRQVEEGTVFPVYVQPGASRTEIAGEREGALRVRLTAPPQEGRANELLRRYLAGCLKVPICAVKIVRGERGRAKWVQVLGITPAQVMARILDLP
jgi:uncharacterized protein (TIGR00251 family)